MRKKSGPTIVEQATETIEGFVSAWKLLDQQVTLRGQSRPSGWRICWKAPWM